jgi:spermidine synthase
MLEGAYGRAVEYVEIARSESERGELVLRERRPDPDDPDVNVGDSGGPTVLELRANGIFVMDTAEHASERALAEAALETVATPRRVLVGGLGLGFTLDRVLGDRRVEHVDVVEIEPALVEWMRDGTIPHGPRLLADERARVVVADIVQAIAEAGSTTYDVVLLDVDNGPAQLVHSGNAAIYDEPFLRAVRERLEPGGALVLWSAERAPALAEVLRSVFDEVEEHDHEVRLQDRDEHYWLYAARRSPGRPAPA